jgi:hypothetical protein
MPRRGGWFPVYAAPIKNHRKFEELTLAELGAWLRIRGEVELVGDEPISRRAACAVLSPFARRPDPFLDRLVADGLFDVTDDGRLAVHDLEDNRPGAFPSDAPEATRERKRKSRVSRPESHDGHEPSHDTPVTSVTLARVDETRQDETRQDETRQDGEVAPAREDDRSLSPTAVIDYIEKRSGRAFTSGPGSKVMTALAADVRDFGETRFIEAMESIPTEHPDVAQLVFGASRKLHPIEVGKNGDSRFMEHDGAEVDGAFQR